MISLEVEFVVARQNQASATYALLTQMAVSSILDKKANAEFKKQIRKLTQS